MNNNMNRMNRRTRQRVEWSEEEIRLLIKENIVILNIIEHLEEVERRSGIVLRGGLIVPRVRILLVISAEESLKIL